MWKSFLFALKQHTRIAVSLKHDVNFEIIQTVAELKVHVHVKLDGGGGGGTRPNFVMDARHEAKIETKKVRNLSPKDRVGVKIGV